MIPTPPAQVQEAPAPREAAFPGFNGLPLRGTVLPAPGGLFAVLVPDSGPLDRDWREARQPHHPGRAFAQWLQGLGVGSLRFDKRMAGSRDPKLDCSLDAQAGDVRAAVTAARALPEAKGRKLLLVGHGEGALLALMAAGEADAALLLGMPGQTLARTIEEQVAKQLPASRAPQNLAFLRAVFQAIRDRGPAPVPGGEVYPALARLGAGLMAPETLAYVRATLDLDPWAMAARSPVPLAAAWGTKDLACPRPAAIPRTFPGQVIDLPGANHVLKAEPRTLADLDPRSALEGYGDDKPLADLTPLAAWIRTFSGPSEEGTSPASR